MGWQNLGHVEHSVFSLEPYTYIVRLRFLQLRVRVHTSDLKTAEKLKSTTKLASEPEKPRRAPPLSTTRSKIVLEKPPRIFCQTIQHACLHGTYFERFKIVKDRGPRGDFLPLVRAIKILEATTLTFVVRGGMRYMFHSFATCERSPLSRIYSCPSPLPHREPLQLSCA